MTAAICVGCGRFKVGALTVCAACQLDPSSDETLVAQSLVMSDHYRTLEQLESASALLAEGKKLSFDDQELTRIKAGLEKLPRDMRMPLGCQILVWLPIAVLVALLGFVVWLYTRIG